MVANNDHCGAGVAHNCNLGGNSYINEVSLCTNLWLAEYDHLTVSIQLFTGDFVKIHATGLEAFNFRINSLTTPLSRCVSEWQIIVASCRSDIWPQ